MSQSQSLVFSVRFGELMLKGKNRSFFLNLLRNSIANKIRTRSRQIEFLHDCAIIWADEQNLAFISDRLQKIPGIHHFFIGRILERDEELLAAHISDYLENISRERKITFKLETKRKDKSFYLDSQEFSKKIAGKLRDDLKNCEADMKNPDHTILVEIDRDRFFVFTEKIAGLGGFPDTSAARALCLLSGGIDSPVAAFLSIKKGLDCVLFHFESTPLTPIESIDKVVDISKRLAEYTVSDRITLVLVPFYAIHQQILSQVKDSYIITIMRRIMYRISQLYCLQHQIPAIVCGDSLAQVASQTIESISTITSDIRIPILRPLICFDKEQIIEISKKIDTYDISIRNFSDCCTVYIPKSPATRPRIDIAVFEEKKIADLDRLIDDSLKNVIELAISPDWPKKISELGLTTDSVRDLL
jgi:thiamine biosynthesis protein ThiI